MPLSVWESCAMVLSQGFVPQNPLPEAVGFDSGREASAPTGALAFRNHAATRAFQRPPPGLARP